MSRVKIKKEKPIYPEKPTCVSDYTMEWINSYIADKATPTKAIKYWDEIQGKKAKDRRQIFVDMFINKKPRNDKTMKALEDIINEKRKEKEAKKK